MPDPRREPSGAPIRVMIVDDSAIVRGLFSRWAEGEPDIALVYSASDGAQAVAKIAACDPDVVVLDVEMPVLSGIEALPKLIAARPNIRVVMASALTEKGAAVTLRALELGAADYIAKPDSKQPGSAEAFRAELFAKIRALGGRAASRRAALSRNPELPPAPPEKAPVAVARPLPAKLPAPAILAIGSSTGGPQALRQFFQALDGAWQGPIVVVQHMPATFTAILADQLSRVSSLPAVEAQDGMPLQVGRIHLAKGDYHLTVQPDRNGFRLALDQGPQENFCRPAVDPLFRSVAACFGPRSLGVVLTGMGQDGREGARAIVGAGGLVMAQDEASSVVWGMPGAVTQAGLASFVRPIPEMIEVLRKLAAGDRP